MPARAEAALPSFAELQPTLPRANPDIQYIAGVWANGAGEPWVWRLRPVEQILGYAEAAGYEPAGIEADRYGVYRVVRLERQPEAA